jgi:prepilin-type N-terminal cleavage/methylation domain-containing protein
VTRRPTRIHRRPRAFTLLELMVVVVLLALLSLLLLGGIEHLTTSARRQQTRAALTACTSLYADWQAATKTTFPTSTMPAPGNMTVDMQGTGDRFGPAVWFTRDVMFHLRQTNTNQAAIGKMSPSSLLAFPAGQGLPFAAGYTPTLWSGTSGYTAFGGGNYGRVYVPDVTVSTTFVYYECIQNVPSPPSGSNLPPAADSGHWLAAYPVLINNGGLASPDSPSVPVPLDGWGNPIIFVPGGELGISGVVEVNGRVPVGSGGMVTSGDTGVPPGTTPLKTHTLVSPNGRPFFASAGPDGDFSRGDDNLYSFESN